MRLNTIGLLVTFALSLLVVPLAATASPPGNMPQIGMLVLGAPPAAPDWKAQSLLLQDLRKIGWLDGQNLLIEYCWANRQPRRLSSLAAKLVRLPVDVIMVAASPAIHVAQRATTTIPIVMVSVGDSVEVRVHAVFPHVISPRSSCRACCHGLRLFSEG
jgi:ABC-type uncharacterized transport system substrate-binding protein